MARSWHVLPLALLVLAPTPLLAPWRAEAQVAREPQLRVLLQEGPAATVAPLAGGGLRVRDRQGRVLQDLTIAAPLQLRLQQGWVELRLAAVEAPDPGARTAVDGPGHPVLRFPGVADGLVDSASGAVVASRATPRAAAVLAGPELWIEPLQPGVEGGLVLNQRRYRGRLQVLPLGSGLQVINHVPLETYLASVVGSEMPASWPQQALRAQAVAARTYALKGRKPAAAYDLKSTVASQVYRGIEAETPSTREAVAATRGLVLIYGSGLIDAVFHSSSGGSTESSGHLWSQQLPYLVSVPDFDQESPVAQWRQPLPADLLARAFAEIGGVRRIEVVATTPTGRIRQARVVGPSGELVLSGAALRSRLGLKSTWVRFELEVPEGTATAANPAAPVLMPPPPLPAFSLPAAGFDNGLQAAPVAIPLPQWVAVGRGFGHGIGMSQWGALAMARRGDSFSAILSHYYRGTQLRPYGELAAVAIPGPGSWPAQASDGDAQVVARGPRPQP
ncbi:MAG: SpoIID/LytB domain-containing protein [Vulcanococcus sp.]